VSTIITQFERDEENRKQVHAVLGYAADLPDDVANLYTAHHNAIASQLPDATAEIAAMLFARCRMHLVLGTTSLLRRFSSPAFRETRSAVEAAGIAYLIRQNPESFRIYQQDKDETSRKKFKNHFTSSHLFAAPMDALKEFYDKCSVLSHTNRRTSHPHVDFDKEVFKYQDLDDPALLMNYLFWTCLSHIEILKVADHVFAGSTGTAIDNFKQERRRIAEKILRFNAKSSGVAYEP